MTPSYRAAIAAYLASGRHIDPMRKGTGVKSLRRMAHELGMSATTVRRWIRTNHRDMWTRYWEQQ